MSMEEIQKYTSPLDIVLMDEQKLRALAVEMAKDIADPLEILKALGITNVEYELIKESRAFKTMYNAALVEWTTAGNTQKRVKFKAAVAVENVLDIFHDEMRDKGQPLSARVELLKTIARFGNIGNQETVAAGAGQYFKLEIHLDGKKEPMIVTGHQTIEHEERETELATEEDSDDF